MAGLGQAFVENAAGLKKSACMIPRTSKMMPNNVELAMSIDFCVALGLLY